MLLPLATAPGFSVPRHRHRSRSVKGEIVAQILFCGRVLARQEAAQHLLSRDGLLCPPDRVQVDVEFIFRLRLAKFADRVRLLLESRRNRTMRPGAA